MNISEAMQLEEVYLNDSFDIIVVGAGHAGCEAAVAAAKLGCRTILFSLTLDAVANLPCNPNIGGTGKGQLVREIDALGGIMAKIADKCAIQYRMLNASKGPAVQSPRAQIDRRLYQEEMKSYLENLPNLQLCQQEVVRLLVKEVAAQANTEASPESNLSSHKARYEVEGILTKNGAIYQAPKVILCTGTYLAGKIFIGAHNYPSGPDNSKPANELGEDLRSLGLPMRRFKTGTPVRVNKHSVDFSNLEEQLPDAEPFAFAFAKQFNPTQDRLPQVSCWITYTNEQTKAEIQANLHRSPLFSGDIEGVGPRYCPSIEDKIVRFTDKLRHQIFIEPMGLHTAELYLQGLSTSLPEDVQKKLVHSLPGLDKAIIQRPAYAIEYDCLEPTILKNSLEVKTINGLYGAGQINGTSGYEEAGSQGLLAGINAARSFQGLEPVVLGRDQAYIGVLIDDLVTKGTNEPYRMMTSRAEYRLLLRQDNADERLTPIGYELGLVSETAYNDFKQKQAAINAEIKRLENVRVTGTEAVNAQLEALGAPKLYGGNSLAQLLLRPNLDYQKLAAFDPERPNLHPVIWKAAETAIKYKGYIELEHKRIAKYHRLEQKKLPDDLDYNQIKGLRIEAQQKLNQFRPTSVGQAGRISGVSPADISVLMVYLEMRERR